MALLTFLGQIRCFLNLVKSWQQKTLHALSDHTHSHSTTTSASIRNFIKIKRMSNNKLNKCLSTKWYQNDLITLIAFNYQISKPVTTIFFLTRAITNQSTSTPDRSYHRIVVLLSEHPFGSSFLHRVRLGKTGVSGCAQLVENNIHV